MERSVGDSNPVGRNIMDKFDKLDLVIGLSQRCVDAIDSLDDESLVEIGEILLGENDEEVLKLKEIIQ